MTKAEFDAISKINMGGRIRSRAAGSTLGPARTGARPTRHNHCKGEKETMRQIDIADVGKYTVTTEDGCKRTFGTFDKAVRYADESRRRYRWHAWVWFRADAEIVCVHSTEC